MNSTGEDDFRDQDGGYDDAHLRGTEYPGVDGVLAPYLVPKLRGDHLPTVQDDEGKADKYPSAMGVYHIPRSDENGTNPVDRNV